MSSYKESFLQYLDYHDINYEDRGEDEVLFRYAGDNFQRLKILVSFDPYGEGMVQLSTWDIVHFPEDKFDKGLIVCNELNAQYRWVKFYIDSDNDVLASIDAYIDQETVGEECYNLIGKIVKIIDIAYPELMKALWG